MSEVDKAYEFKIIKMIVDEYLDESVPITEESLIKLETDFDRIVYDLAIKIFSQTGHKIEFSIIRDIITSRIEILKYQLVAQKKHIVEKVRLASEQEAQQAAAEKARQITLEDLWRVEVANALAEFDGDEIKALIFVRLRSLISDELGVEESRITLDSHIAHDLHADECETLNLAMTLEEVFDFEIPDDMLGAAKVWPTSYSSNTFGDSFPIACTVRELLNFICEKS